jgi:hypothetical protein
MRAAVWSSGSRRGIGALLALPVVLCACFNPMIADGGFRCSAEGACPEGFQCEAETGLCKLHPASIVSGGDGGSGDGGKGDAADAGGKPACFEARQGCERSMGGICDPYCQAGCECGQKCSVNTAGEATCNPPSLPTLVGTLEACTIYSSGSPSQSDDCAPGHVCVEGETCSPRCFRFCRSDRDCDNAYCDRVVGHGTQRVCGLPNTDACTPLGVPSNVGCGPGMACYVSSTHSDHTLCDCPRSDGRIGSTCTAERDCNPGLACAYLLTVGKAQCLQVCELTKNGADCINGGNCRQYRGAAGDAPPHARWGFCY